MCTVYRCGYRHVHGRMCVDMCAVMCTGMCTEMCAGMCVEMWVDMCADMRAGMCVRGHACRHVPSLIHDCTEPSSPPRSVCKVGNKA